MEQQSKKFFNQSNEQDSQLYRELNQKAVGL